MRFEAWDRYTTVPCNPFFCLSNPGSGWKIQLHNTVTDFTVVCQTHSLPHSWGSGIAVASCYDPYGPVPPSYEAFDTFATFNFLENKLELAQTWKCSNEGIQRP